MYVRECVYVYSTLCNVCTAGDDSGVLRSSTDKMMSALKMNGFVNTSILSSRQLSQEECEDMSKRLRQCGYEVDTTVDNQLQLVKASTQVLKCFHSNQHCITQL